MWFWRCFSNAFWDSLYSLENLNNITLARKVKYQLEYSDNNFISRNAETQQNNRGKHLQQHLTEQEHKDNNNNI